MEKIGIITTADGMKEEPVRVVKGGYFCESYNPRAERLNTWATVIKDGKQIAVKRARWDTGSNITGIARNKTEVLQPDWTAEVRGVGSSAQTDIYKADVVLPGGIRLSNVDVWAFDIEHLDADMIIGMDVISRGQLTVGMKNGMHVFSFFIES